MKEGTMKLSFFIQVLNEREINLKTPPQPARIDTLIEWEK